LIDALERVVLVDGDDREVGTAPKLDAHRQGALHRALSVILQDTESRLLLQKRHIRKYHSGGLWTNSCCSHPRPGEPVAQAARRRLREEMGIDCPLRSLMTVTYCARVGEGIVEHEIVHVFAGLFSGAVRPDPAEADGYAWADPDALARDVRAVPERYSVWFRKYVTEHWPSLTQDPCWRALRAEAGLSGGTRLRRS
jgi:isopentenyl-diphosphate delta-isomerase